MTEVSSKRKNERNIPFLIFFVVAVAVAVLIAWCPWRKESSLRRLLRRLHEGGLL